MTEIYLASSENFSGESMDAFDRSQSVTMVYRLKDGALVPEYSPFTEDWSPERKREKAQEILSGRYITYLAFTDGRVSGAILLDPVLNKNRLIVDSFHVSREFRRHGIGRLLFQKAVCEAKRRGASALYISACSAVETIDFYTAMGCRVSKDPIAECVEDEPFDIQLECAINQ